jgi:hypothetical protein
MSDDLTTRLLAAIEETEKIAYAAAARAGMDWEADPDTQYLGGSVTSCSTGDTIVYPEGRPTEDEAAHIGRHDPANVLRHCAAHRKIVERAERLSASAGDDPTSVVAAVAAATAKADLVDLAAGYDLTTEPAP